MKRTKKLLMASAAVVALAIAPSGAQAFDSTNWVWDVNVDKDIVETVDIDLDITGVSTVSGMVTIEAFQENVGNVTASATVTDFENSPPGLGEGGTVLVDETITVSVSYPDPNGEGNTVPDGGSLITDDGDTPLTTTFLGGQLSEQANGFNDIIDLNIQGEFDIEAVDGLINDAIDLPKIENIATAVGNNFSLDSTVASNVNVGQLNYGGFNAPEGGSIQEPAAILPHLGILGSTFNSTGNEHLGNIYAAGLAAALGVITQGEVLATATVGGPEADGILNASVENAATAVGNNISVDIDANEIGDAFLVADLSQFNYANTTATATVDDVSINNYTNFGGAGFGPCGGCLEGEPQIPVISNVATAVGNNISVNVSNVDLD